MRLLPYNGFVLALLILSLLGALLDQRDLVNIGNRWLRYLIAGFVFFEFFGFLGSFIFLFVYSVNTVALLVSRQWKSCLLSALWVLAILLYEALIFYLYPMLLYAT